MFIETVRNRNSPPCILLRETYRSEGKVKHRTLANLSKLPADVLAGLRSLLKANPPAFSPSGTGAFRIQRSLPHGHVSATLCRNTIVSTLPRHPLLATRDRTHLSPTKYPRSPEPNPCP